MWRETTKHERNMKIFKEEFDAFLPEKILDFHVHINNREIFRNNEGFVCGGHQAEKYDLDDLSQDMTECYPDRETFAVCFGGPNPKYDNRNNDKYVAENCDKKRFFPFRLFDPTEDPQAVKKDIVEQGFMGIKPYLTFVRKEDPNDVEIREMLPDWMMEIANELELIIMLHIPRKQRLADPLNQEQLVDLCERYPKARMVMAHVGRAYYMKNVVGYLDKLKGLPNLWYDVSMVNNWEVLEYLFQNVPQEKLLYATDTPIALAPGKSVEINDQYTYVTPVPWVLSISDDHEKLVFTSFLYEELRAIKKAVERCGLDRSFVEALFYDNGAKLLGI